MRVTQSREMDRTRAKRTLNNECLTKCERLQKVQTASLLHVDANGNGIIYRSIHIED